MNDMFGFLVVLFVCVYSQIIVPLDASSNPTPISSTQETQLWESYSDTATLHLWKVMYYHNQENNKLCVRIHEEYQASDAGTSRVSLSLWIASHYQDPSTVQEDTPLPFLATHVLQINVAESSTTVRFHKWNTDDSVWMLVSSSDTSGTDADASCISLDSLDVGSGHILVAGQLTAMTDGSTLHYSVQPNVAEELESYWLLSIYDTTDDWEKRDISTGDGLSSTTGTTGALNGYTTTDVLTTTGSSTSLNSTSAESKPFYKGTLFIALVAGIGGFLVVAITLVVLLRFYVRRANSHRKFQENTVSEVELGQLAKRLTGQHLTPRDSVDSTANDKPEEVSVSTLVPRQVAVVSTRPTPQRTSSAIRNLRRKDEQELAYKSSDEEEKSTPGPKVRKASRLAEEEASLPVSAEHPNDEQKEDEKTGSSTNSESESDSDSQ